MSWKRDTKCLLIIRLKTTVVGPMATLEKIDATLVGVGQLIKSTRFSVPHYQRPYSWTEIQVNDFCKDLGDAVSKKSEDYFLGTIVTTRSGEEGRRMIIDGQQRLVTTSILIAAIRDFFHEKRQSDRAQDIERDYLYKRDIRTQSPTPHILLTPEDRDFFIQKIATLSQQQQSIIPSTNAQKNLTTAVQLTQTFIQNLTRTTHDPDGKLLDLLDFLTDKTKVVSVSVNNESSAFVIFEVLNDRGLDLSVVDLLKNYLFSTSGDRLKEAKSAWEKMNTIISEVGSDIEIKTFIRHIWAAKHGMVRERDLYDSIRQKVTNNIEAIELVNYFTSMASILAGLSNSSHDYWQKFDNSIIIESVDALNDLNVTQHRPLLFAIFNKFDNEEVTKTLQMIVSWSVRFMICGSAGSGTLETAYSDCAKKITEGTIKSAKQLWEAMKDKVPTDEEFESSFILATVSNATLARYYLRVLEKQNNSKEEEIIVNSNQNKVNLEHILPKTKSSEWSHIPDDEYSTLYKRIGNLTLIAKRLNSKAANDSFQKKKKYFEQSNISITKELCGYEDWTGTEIESRQRSFAKLAVKAWSAKPH